MLSSDSLPPPLVVHIIHRLAAGGLENGLVNLINHMPPERYRHAIVCLTDSTSFQDRIQQKEVPVIALHKGDGQDLGLYLRLWKIMRNLRPALVHTRNLSALEYQIIAVLVGTPGRIHGEHGRDIDDLDGTNVKYNLLRKTMRGLIHRYIAVSTDLAHWLIDTVKVRAHRVTHIYNGVDVQRFHPRSGPRPALGPQGFTSPRTFVIGTVGRMEAVKDQLTLVRAFLYLLDSEPDARQRLRLAMIGEGVLRQESYKLLRAAGVEHLAWLPGERSDIPDMMRGLDLFVLPSIREGISNTILEAMATALPVVATRVGGNTELVDEGKTGLLVPPQDPVHLAQAIRAYLMNPDQLAEHGHAGRKKVEEHFSMDMMVNGYLAAYDTVLHERKTA